ncbi:unnamed protein product [Camellia sinensis]
MAAKKFTTILILTTVALVVMGSAITGKALSDCAKNCMPTCLAEEDTTMSDCENSCESFCETQGSNSPVNIFVALERGHPNLMLNSTRNKYMQNSMQQELKKSDEYRIKYYDSMFS